MLHHTQGVHSIVECVFEPQLLQRTRNSVLAAKPPPSAVPEKKENKLSGGQYRGESPPVALNFRVYLQSLDPYWDLQRVVGGPKKGQRVLKHHHTTFYEGRNKI